MDLFCNDKYWSRMEDKTSKLMPEVLKPELQRRKFDQLDEEDSPLVKQWGKYDFKFKL